jgi:hypothetical protein
MKLHKGASKNLKNPFFLWEKTRMRALKSVIYYPLPEGEGIYRDAHKTILISVFQWNHILY